ncbi:MAG: hypothetical protein ACLRZ6_12905 [Lachnospiraceae bacterium]
MELYEKENQTMWRHLRFSAQGIALNLKVRSEERLYAGDMVWHSASLDLVNNFWGKGELLLRLSFFVDEIL